MPGTRCAVAVCSISLQVTKKKQFKHILSYFSKRSKTIPCLD